MIQGCQNLGLTLKAAHSVRITRELIGQNFDRNFTLEFRISCPVHLAHAAFAEQRGDFVRAKLSADRDRQESLRSKDLNEM